MSDDNLQDEEQRKRIKEASKEYFVWLKSLNEEDKKEHYRKMFGVPKVSGVCDDCGAKIVRQVRSMSSSGYSFDSPKCSQCEKWYFGDKDAPKVGIKEFEEMLSEHLTL